MGKGYKQPIPFRYISRLAKLRMKELQALAVIVQAKKGQRVKGGKWKAFRKDDLISSIQQAIANYRHNKHPSNTMPNRLEMANQFIEDLGTELTFGEWLEPHMETIVALHTKFVSETGSDMEIGPFAFDLFCSDPEFVEEETKLTNKPSLSVKAVIDHIDPSLTYNKFYRSMYKAIACGPSIGFLLKDQYGALCWFYNEELPELTFDQRPSFGISVSSIVEGSEAEVEGDQLTGDFTIQDFWDLVESVNQQAGQLWDESNQE